MNVPADLPNKVNRHIAENVVRLLHRAGMNASDLAKATGMNKGTLGRKLDNLGRVEWKASEIVVVSIVLDVRPCEIIDCIPEYPEWKARRDGEPS